jgi:hypothetical protein
VGWAQAGRPTKWKQGRWQRRLQARPLTKRRGPWWFRGSECSPSTGRPVLASSAGAQGRPTHTVPRRRRDPCPGRRSTGTAPPGTAPLPLRPPGATPVVLGHPSQLHPGQRLHPGPARCPPQHNPPAGLWFRLPPRPACAPQRLALPGSPTTSGHTSGQSSRIPARSRQIPAFQHRGQVWPFYDTPVIPAPGRPLQEDEFRPAWAT